LRIFNSFKEEQTMAQDLTLDEVRRMAADIGMTRLSEDQLRELARATQAARARRAGLRVDTLQTADEPAHVFRLLGERTQ
jgi:hypothetical protein